jgi:hypothetical protein
MRAAKNMRMFFIIIVLLLFFSFSTNAFVTTDTTFENGTFTGTTNANNLMMAPVGIVAWYELNETAGATAYDYSPNQMNGTIIGATRIPGVGYSFDGIDDTIQITSTNAFDSTQMSAYAWVSFANIGAGGQYHSILSKGPQDEDFFMGYDNILLQDDFFGEIGLNGGTIDATGNIVFANNVMYMLALVHDSGRRVRIYANGVQASVSAGTADRFAGNGAFKIGNGYAGPLNGTIARVMIFNTTLSVADLTDYINNLTLPSSGTYESQTYDLGSNPLTTISWVENTPTGTSVTVEYAVSSSSNSGFSTWIPITSGQQLEPTQRYMRYRITMTTTDRITTPSIQSVTISSSQQGTKVGLTSTTDLNEDKPNPYFCYVQINDTVTVQTRTYRYRIGTGAWSPWSNLLGTGPYFASLTETWASYNGQTLQLEVYTNNSVGNVTNVTLSKQILDINHPPSFATIGDKTGRENQELTFSISAFDQDGDTLTFTSDTFTITQINNGLADASWTPGTTDVGNQTVQFSVSDGNTNVIQTIYVNVQNVNDAPVFTSTPDVKSYMGESINFTIKATDIDGDALTFSADPAYFSISSVATGNGSNSTEYTGYINNYIPISSHKYTTNMRFSVRDGTESVNAIVNFDIDYCGDFECQTTYETIDNCAKDCDEYAFNKFSIVPPEKACFNSTINITVFNATSRYSCTNTAKAKYGLAICDPLEDVDLVIYLEGENGLLTEKGSGTTSSDGIVQLLVDEIGTYKVIGTRENFAREIVKIKSQKCLAYDQTSNRTIIKRTVDNKLVQKFKDNVQELIPINNTFEKPLEIVPNDPRANWILMLIYFVLVPILLAGMTFASSVYYDKYKNDNIYILKARIFAKETKISYLPQYIEIKKKLMPYIEQVRKPMMIYLSMVYEMVKPVLKPLIDKIAELYDKTIKKK